jgi:hypothetical protein
VSEWRATTPALTPQPRAGPRRLSRGCSTIGPRRHGTHIRALLLWLHHRPLARPGRHFEHLAPVVRSSRRVIYGAFSPASDDFTFPKQAHLHACDSKRTIERRSIGDAPDVGVSGQTPSPPACQRGREQDGPLTEDGGAGERLHGRARSHYSKNDVGRSYLCPCSRDATPRHFRGLPGVERAPTSRSPTSRRSSSTATDEPRRTHLGVEDCVSGARRRGVQAHRVSIDLASVSA